MVAPRLFACSALMNVVLDLNKYYEDRINKQHQSLQRVGVSYDCVLLPIVC